MKEIIHDHIQKLKNGDISDEEFMAFVQRFPYENLGDIKLDFHRKLRRGLPEAIYGSGKTVDQLELIVSRFEKMGEEMLITRIDPGNTLNWLPGATDCCTTRKPVS